MGEQLVQWMAALTADCWVDLMADRLVE